MINLFDDFLRRERTMLETKRIECENKQGYSISAARYQANSRVSRFPLSRHQRATLEQ